MPHRTGNSNVRPDFSSAAMASVYVIRSKLDATNASSRVTHVLSTRSAKNAMSSARSSSTAPKMCLQEVLGQVALSSRSAKAISGSIIQNSARWRLVLEFSARKVGPKV